VIKSRANKSDVEDEELNEDAVRNLKGRDC
jgi:hypothetical protein